MVFILEGKQLGFLQAKQTPQVHPPISGLQNGIKQSLPRAALLAWQRQELMALREQEKNSQEKQLF